MRHHTLKSKEEVCLSTFAACKALNIIDKQKIEILVAVLEGLHFLRMIVVEPADGIGKFIDVLLGRNTADAGTGMRFDVLMADSLHQVCFTQTDAAVDKKRVVNGIGAVGHLLSCGISKLVGLTLNNVFKREVGQ